VDYDRLAAAVVTAFKAANPFAAKKDDAEAEVDCPECGKKMPKGGKCPSCGYEAKAPAELVVADVESNLTREVFEQFVKCGMEAVPYPPPAPAEPMTFDDIVEKRNAEKLSWEAQDLQWTFMDSVRSILAAAPKGEAVPLLRQTLAQYGAALGKLEPKKAAEAREKAGRVFSRANEAAMSELRRLLAEADKTLGSLLAQVAPNPTPEGEANLPNVLGPGPTGGEKTIRVVVPGPAPEKPAAVIKGNTPLRIVASPEKLASVDRERMLTTGKLPAPKVKTKTA